MRAVFALVVKPRVMTSLECNVSGKTGLKTAQRSGKHCKKQVTRAVFAAQNSGKHSKKQVTRAVFALSTSPSSRAATGSWH